MVGQNLAYLYHHIIFPQQLPNGGDQQKGSCETLTGHLNTTCKRLRDTLPTDYYHTWSTILRLLETFQKLHTSSGLIAHKQLLEALRHVGPDDVVVLHVSLQNSGLILRQAPDGDYVFESFEAAAPAAEVLAAGTLSWQFPSQSFKIPTKVFNDPLFQSSLAKFIEQASVENVKSFAAVSAKAGSRAFESRDTTKPAIIGQLLMAIIAAIGHSFPVPCTVKRVHDEVIWDDGASLPFRRSASYLVLRLAIQRTLSHLLGASLGLYYYKVFVAQVVAGVCDQMTVDTNTPPDWLSFARSKVAKRVAKIENLCTDLPYSIFSEADKLLDVCKPYLMQVITRTNARLDLCWDHVRAITTKKVFPLPKRTISDDTTLKLANSMPFIQNVLQQVHGKDFTATANPISRVRTRKFDLSWAQNSAKKSWSPSKYVEMADFEDDLKNLVAQCSAVHVDSAIEPSCQDILQKMKVYHRAAIVAYEDNPDHLSSMLLLLFELWKSIDIIALRSFPILADYNPGFPASALYYLRLSSLRDMERLRDIESYLTDRRQRTIPMYPSISSAMNAKSFGPRFFDECPSMQRTMKQIRSADTKAKEDKLKELRMKTEEYEQTLHNFMTSTCLYTTDHRDPSIKRHQAWSCSRCIAKRKIDKMRIEIHESMLPEDEHQAKCFVFELRVPQDFACWREATWRLLQIGRSLPQESERPPRLSLKEYKPLDEFSNSSSNSSVVLCSHTKSFYDTHYRWVPFPANEESVCLPNGLKCGLFDSEAGVWTSSHLKAPCYASYSSIAIPNKSAFSSLADFLSTDLNGKSITYNDIVAGFTKCPRSLTVQEYTTFQDLRLGSKSLWLKLLRELTSSNLNFSSLEVTHLISHLALISGPPEDSSILRSNHWVFQDDTFTIALLAQVSKRLELVATNWREPQVVQSMLIILERIFTLTCSEDLRQKAIEVTLSARTLTQKWIHLLRQETNAARSVESAQKRSEDSLHAALLCRKTFFLEKSGGSSFNREVLACYLECSICIRQNLSNQSGFIWKLSANIRGLYLSDLRLLQQMESTLRREIERTPDAVSDAVNVVCNRDTEDGFAWRFTHWTFLAGSQNWWITAITINRNGFAAQEIHLDILEGTLLIAGQPLGQLPDAYASQPFFYHLFGQKVFLTYQSELPGMAYKFATLFEEHAVHLGVVNGVYILKAIDGKGRVLQHLPPNIFENPNCQLTPDIPSTLINKHVHWLDVRNNVIEIRPEKTMWRSKWSDWTINLHTYQASRRQSLLIDPNSKAFDRIARVIEPFQARRNMLMYQPEKSNMVVHLPELELSFSVNKENLLRCRQLRAVIDVNQDAGCFYGLDSKLVLLDDTTRKHRSIIVPISPAILEKIHNHTKVSIRHSRYYAQFSINSTLRRLEYAIEPRLVYFKAYLHAVTSFPQPDPLTGRTGTAEALECLQSGFAQPYIPLDAEAMRILGTLADLTPKRVYYPENSKQLQRITWNHRLRADIQHDAFLPLVNTILRQHEMLSRFHIGRQQISHQKMDSDMHLLNRARCRSDKYRPIMNYSASIKTETLQMYAARDVKFCESAKNSFSAASYIHRWTAMKVDCNLAQIFRNWPYIQGTNEVFETYLFTDLMELDFSKHWLPLYAICRKAERHDRYSLMFLFASMSFNGNVNMSLVKGLIAVAINSDSEGLHLPIWPCYSGFCFNQVPEVSHLLPFILPHCLPYVGDAPDDFGIAISHKQRKKFEEAKRKHEEASRSDCEQLASSLLSQWPTYTLSFEDYGKLSFLDVPTIIEVVVPEWQRLVQNLDLSKCITQCHALFQALDGTPISNLVSARSTECFPTVSQSETRPSLQDMMSNIFRDTDNIVVGTIAYPSIALNQATIGLSQLPCDVLKRQETYYTICYEPGVAINALQQIVSEFSSSTNFVRKTYGEDLQRSLNALRIRPSGEIFAPKSDQSLAHMRTAICDRLHDTYDLLQAKMADSYNFLNAGGLLPYMTPVTLLEMLRSNTKLHSNSIAHKVLVDYAKQITRLQQVNRIDDALLKDDLNLLSDEIDHIRHASKRQSDDSDWLLLQIDFDFIIRPDQHDVAKAMIRPTTNSNAVLQLNMGQGKSSIICPMVVTRLADRHRLARIVVPRPLLLQMGQLLQTRLGGLVGRTVSHIPFSRKSSTTIEYTKAYHKLHSDVMQRQGILLSLPEHLLSFQLSGLQRLVDGHLKEAEYMINIQKWLDKRCRDILDESDHMLATRTQLIYPSGSQRIVDGHPMRWKLVESLLHLVVPLVRELANKAPDSIEIVERSRGTFPTIFLLNQPIKETFIRKLTERVLDGEGSILPVQCETLAHLEYARKFLSLPCFDDSSNESPPEIFSKSSDARQSLLLLRALLVHRILLMAIAKRYNVTYGIHPDRDPISVPFTSKGIPNDSSEFGHPDVAIILTCLSFYYSGISLDQFRQCVGHLLKSDEPAVQFDTWIMHVKVELPSSSHAHNSLNVEDEIQCKQLWLYLRFQMTVINYYLNNFVFPRHARTFERKIVRSGWDIPLPATHVESKTSDVQKENQKPMTAARLPVTSSIKGSLTTGFSGTSDNKTLLPLTIQQNDLTMLAHTNAEVLTYLLQPRNRKCVHAADNSGKRLTEDAFLRKLNELGIRILLDAGAMILEHDNKELVEAWLHIDVKAEAAVYFRTDGQARIVHRSDGKEQPLAASPYAENMESCVVYLDEAHTRGVDLKLPSQAKAALTLGMNQTKDHTVQAAMRLRKLAVSQSVIFFAPPEVYQSILNFRRIAANGYVDTRDVITWLLEMTCVNIEQLQPLYISQGFDYCGRLDATHKAPDMLTDSKQRSAFLKVLEQPEQYSLEELYGPGRKGKRRILASATSPQIGRFLEKLKQMRKDLSDTVDTVQASAHEEVEQEREVAVEIEAVREKKRPNHATGIPQTSLHRDIKNFAQTGRLGVNTWVCKQAFISLRQTALGQRLGINSSATTSNLYVTEDFSNTVAPGPKRHDEYARDVHWVLWSTVSHTAVIISDYEADALIPILCNASPPNTYLIIYSPPVTKSMLPFDTLKIYSVPPLPMNWLAPSWLIRDLGLFAGRLYFDYDSQCSTVCDALGLPTPPDLIRANEDSETVGELWHVLPFDETSKDTESAREPFSKAPLLFMQEWLGIRRKGLDVSHTMMGELCRGRSIFKES